MRVIKEILEIKRKFIEKRKRKLSFEQLLKLVPVCQCLSLKKKLREEKFGIIAEVKKASPSAGIIKERYYPGKIASTYEKYGASGISVLTCEPYFLGKLEHLKKVRKSVNLPILQKDFVIDKYQIVEGKYYGADVILLIACILTKNELKTFSKIAEQIKMETIVEIHNKEDLKKTLSIKNWDNKILGINNRNLKTMKTDIKTTLNLIKSIRQDKITVISESGIKNLSDIKRLQECGVKGVLVGEALLKSKNISLKLNELTRRENG